MNSCNDGIKRILMEARLVSQDPASNPNVRPSGYGGRHQVGGQRGDDCNRYGRTIGGEGKLPPRACPADANYSHWKDERMRQLDADFERWREQGAGAFPQDFELWLRAKSEPRR